MNRTCVLTECNCTMGNFSAGYVTASALVITSTSEKQKNPSGFRCVALPPSERFAIPSVFNSVLMGMNFSCDPWASPKKKAMKQASKLKEGKKSNNKQKLWIFPFADFSYFSRSHRHSPIHKNTLSSLSKQDRSRMKGEIKIKFSYAAGNWN